VAQKYSLREIKYARTKIAIMNAFIERLKKFRFEEISIRQICQDVEISEATFFNYFSQKLDIINYYLRLLFTKVLWKARKEAPKGRYLALIEAVFKNTASELGNINIIYQIISVLIMQRERPDAIIISDIEKQFAFPECSGIEDIETTFIDRFFEGSLKEALKNGELPKKIDINDVLVSLLAILGGTLLAAKLGNVRDYTYHYMRQIRLLWKGLGVKV